MPPTGADGNRIRRAHRGRETAYLNPLNGSGRLLADVAASDSRRNEKLEAEKFEIRGIRRENCANSRRLEDRG